MEVSTGFKDLLLGPHAFVDIFNGGAIKIYANAQPAHPDLTDEGATVVATITANGGTWNFGNPLNNGLKFSKPPGPYVYKDPAQTWICTPTINLVAAWFRLYSPDPAESGGSSLTLARIDGTIQELTSMVAADMFMDDTDLMVGTSFVVNYFLYTILPILGA
jgi:hypothetical protein